MKPQDGQRMPPKTGQPLLEVTDLQKHFPIRKGVFRRQVGAIRAVDGVSLSVRSSETLGLVGESGCGKSTLARTILRLIEPTSGSIRFDGREITGLGHEGLRTVRQDVQIVFQDPFASLDPRMTIHDIIAEPLRIHARYEPSRIAELLELVGLDPDQDRRRPQQFSGGQRQRIGIARALALEPKLLILDEPVSALDVSIQAQIINLLRELQQRLGLAYLFVAHDLSVVRHISHRVAVMYLGRIVERGPTRDVFRQPAHPYTKALLSAVPVPRPEGRETRRRIILQGDVPSPSNPPSGCRFRTRCWKAEAVCAQDEPRLEGPDEHESACFFPVADLSARRS